MRLKTFYAKTMTEAMQMVRDTLGEDAIIIATREEKGGKAVRVTAAIEPAFEVGRSNRPATPDDWLQYDDEEAQESAIAEELTEAMLRHNVPEDVMDQILSCATVVGLEQPAAALVASLEHLFNFRPLPQKPFKKAIMLMGPPGSGKTVTIAKMAARATMAGLRVATISCDSVRAGGYEQLAAFTRLLDVPLHKAQSAAELKTTLERLRGHDQILIDTAGVNPFSPTEIKEIARLLSIADIEANLVLPGGLDAQESTEIARVFSTIGVQGLIASRIDIARRLGGLLAAAHGGGLHFTDSSTSPKVAEGLTPFSPESLAEMLMPGVKSTQARANNRPASKQSSSSRLH